jgi:hypothetical protein
MAEPSLEILQTLILRSLEEQRTARLEMREIRRETGDVRTLLLALNDKVTRLDRDIHEIKDDIWIMLKAEVMGRMGHFETRVEAKLDAMSDRIDAIEEPKP